MVTLPLGYLFHILVNVKGKKCIQYVVMVSIYKPLTMVDQEAQPFDQVK